MTSSQRVMIYGAYGFTGRLIVDQALRAELRPLVAGRDRGRLQALSETTSLAARDFSLDDPEALRKGLADVDVLVNAAGPFSQSARTLVGACLRTRTHYLDVSGEVESLKAVAECHADARRADVMLLPGVGFDVVPSDCLAAFAARRVGGARRLRIGLSGLSRASRGSLRSIFEQAGKGVWLRERGRLRSVPAGELSQHRFDYGAGPSASVPVSWGDLVTSYYSTGCPDITTYFEATTAVQLGTLLSSRGGRLLQAPWAQSLLSMLPDAVAEGPDRQQRAGNRAIIVVEAISHSGARTIARLTTPDVYELTARSVVRVLGGLAEGAAEPGFQTPALLFGCEFGLSLPGVELEVLV
jgi:short subunit dehydrogenase-like uncharacterized protein